MNIGGDLFISTNYMEEKISDKNVANLKHIKVLLNSDRQRMVKLVIICYNGLNLLDTLKGRLDKMEKKYQIFISSTYTDLIEAREKVRDAILTMMHFPIGMEMFSAGDEEQWEIIQDTIDSSDYYVLIVGHRYGSVIKVGNDAGISYTEKEFRYAREKGIPILAFIRSDDAVAKKDDFENDPDKMEKLAAFKDIVKNGRTVEWWETPDQLARQVTAALHKQMDRKKRPGWVRGDSFNIEASHAEILKLNKLVRDLQEENSNLRSKIVQRTPKLVAELILDNVSDVDKPRDADEEKAVEDDCRSHSDLVLSLDKNSIKLKLLPIYTEHYRNRYEQLDRSCVDTYLQSYVSDEALRRYNEALPTEDEIDTYIEKLSAYQRIRKGGVAFKLQISNDGTAKATDIRVFIDFPEEFLLFDISDIEDIEKPKEPELPENPIERAEEEYAKRMNPSIATATIDWARTWDLNHQNTLRAISALSRYDITNSYTQSLNFSLDIEEHGIVVESQQIPHKDLRLFDGIYIVPTKKGKFKVEVSVMCSEFLEPIESYIDVEVV